MSAGVTKIIAGVVALVASTAMAQDPQVRLELPTNFLEVGETINVQLACINTGKPDTPQTDIPDGLSLKLVNSTPSMSSFTEIINGRRSQRLTYTYVLQLSAQRVGTYMLGPISVGASGRSYQSQAERIVVRRTVQSNKPQADRIIYASVEAHPRSLYVTETVSATLTFGIRKVVIGGRSIAMDLLRQVLDLRSSQLSVFQNGQATTSERWLTDSNGQRHRYTIYRVTKTIRTEEAGELLIGPVFFVANYPTAVRRGFFGRNEVSMSRREVARAEAIVIEVKSPPEKGRPADYTGAIGRFNLRVTAKPTRVEQGQPITLTISLSGSSMDGVAGPDLAKQPQLASRFDFTKDELVGDVEGRAKVFRRAVFPKQVGEQTIPPISWSHFDPRAEAYVTLTSDPIAISVDPPPDDGTTVFTAEAPEAASKGTALTVLTGGISPNFTDAEAVLANQAFALTPPWLTSLLAAPMIWMVVALTTRHRARLKTDSSFARRSGASRRAHRSIKLAIRGAGDHEQLHGLAEAMTNYVADRFGLGSGTLTPSEVRTTLASHRFSEAVAAQIVEFLENCDASRYAPGAGEDVSPKQYATRVRTWIKKIEKHRS